MKVYTKIVYDKDNNIIEEHSYDYNGPVSWCEDDQDEFARDKKFIADRMKNYSYSNSNISRNTKNNIDFFISMNKPS